MFDLAWSEIALIGVVALVVIGPKDLPEAIRGVAKGVQKLRRMAAEFQTHADELVREAKLDEVRNQINEVKSAVNEIRNFDLRGTLEKNIDGDGTIRSTFESDPLKPATDWSAPPVSSPPPEMMEGATAGMAPEAPAFIPPADAARTHLPPVPPTAPEAPAAPAFVPPSSVAATPAAEPVPASAHDTAPSPAHQTAPSPAHQSAPSPAHQTAPSPAHQSAPSPAHQSAPSPATATEKA